MYGKARGGGVAPDTLESKSQNMPRHPLPSRWPVMSVPPRPHPAVGSGQPSSRPRRGPDGWTEEGEPGPRRRIAVPPITTRGASSSLVQAGISFASKVSYNAFIQRAKAAAPPHQQPAGSTRPARGESGMPRMRRPCSARCRISRRPRAAPAPAPAPAPRAVLTAA
jgi:hypothetical protein